MSNTTSNVVENVQVRFLADDNAGNFKAICMVNFKPAEFPLTSLQVKVLDSSKGLFIGMPGARGRKDSTRFFPDITLDEDVQKEVTRKTITQFKLAVANRKAGFRTFTPDPQYLPAA
jgi:DNA-binding cell septation regulator SpoVG